MYIKPEKTINRNIKNNKNEKSICTKAKESVVNNMKRIKKLTYTCTKKMINVIDYIFSFIYAPVVYFRILFIKFDMNIWDNYILFNNIVDIACETNDKYLVSSICNNYYVYNSKIVKDLIDNIDDNDNICKYVIDILSKNCDFNISFKNFVYETEDGGYIDFSQDMNEYDMNEEDDDCNENESVRSTTYMTKNHYICAMYKRIQQYMELNNHCNTCNTCNNKINKKMYDYNNIRRPVVTDPFMYKSCNNKINKTMYDNNPYDLVNDLINYSQCINNPQLEKQ